MSMSIRDQEALKQAVADIRDLKEQVAILRSAVDSLLNRRPQITMPLPSNKKPGMDKAL